ncbi:MAG: class I SAM-dependent methyltransferase [Lachnospiraceae bacterium]|nr:class I SAM-dependent methyltransferase [Lachnospiraceae bacterium]
MNNIEQDNKSLIDFWDQAIAITDEEKESVAELGAADWKEMAPSEKLCEAVMTLGKKKKVLDYGCGNAWAGIIAAKSGCPDVTAVDVSKGPIETAKFYADKFEVREGFKTFDVGFDWLGTVADKSYDGIICSNVLDVIPTETAKAIIDDLARISTDDAIIVIGMNFYMTPEECAERGMELVDGRKFYSNGVLRLVFHSDEEWTDIFSARFDVERLDHFAWPGESAEKRRLFVLRKK